VYGKIPFFTSHREMLAASHADVVIVSTPHHLHAPIAVAAANAGKHVLVEKPMALSAKECEAMIAAAKKNGVKLWVVKQNRHNVPVKLVKDVIDRKKLGRVFMVQCNIMWNRVDSYYKDSDWRGRKKTEGGALFTQASHFIDLMVWLFGDITSASAVIETKDHHIQVEDCGTATLGFRSGVMGSMLWTTCVYNKNYEGSITIIGEKGTIKIGGQYLNTIEHWDVQGHPLPDKTAFTDKPNLYGKYQGTSSNHDKVIRDIISNLGNKKHKSVYGEEGIRTVKAIELIYNHTK
jgi:UDP-N-acetyl-2-amino-2-deoxyglucuronate dehydrogenase